MSSKFVKNSVNFSEINLLKKSSLVPILEAYNEKILKSNGTQIYESNSFFIPNNNKKYYLLITNKNAKYKTLYFFPNNYEPVNILEKYTVSDFYIEIDNNILDNFKESNYLFEGYYYNQTDFFITDILSIGSKIIDCDYSLRYSLINNFFNDETKLKNLNGHLSISIHSMFKYDDDYENILRVFKNNFIFKNEINNIEIIKENNLEKIKQHYVIKKKNALKIITKTKYIDVYTVNNIETNNKENILYVKTLNDSKLLHELLTKSDTFTIECEFNDHFNKWAPLFQ